MDFGFDALFLNQRLSAGFDWYRRDTKDMLTAGQALPAVLGASVPVENAADLKTTGWELSLGWNDRLESGFAYWVKGVYLTINLKLPDLLIRQELFEIKTIKTCITKGIKLEQFMVMNPMVCIKQMLMHRN